MSICDDASIYSSDEWIKFSEISAWMFKIEVTDDAKKIMKVVDESSFELVVAAFMLADQMHNDIPSDDEEYANALDVAYEYKLKIKLIPTVLFNIMERVGFNPIAYLK
jgi:hypothetical protein